MTSRSSLFSSYFVSTGRDKVKVVDRTLSSISGKGSVHVSPTLSLSLVLYVPKFATNLLSISRLTKDLKCQDLHSKEMIGSDQEADGLYLLNADAV